MKVRVQNHALYMVVFAKGAVALDTPMPSENDAATPLQRRGMIPPRRLGEAQIIRCDYFNYRELVLPLHGSDDLVTFHLQMTKVRRLIDIHGIQLFKKIDV